MTDQPKPPTEEAAAIHEVARHARRLRLSIRILCWSIMPFPLMLVFDGTFRLFFHRPLDPAWILFSMLAPFLVAGWLAVEQTRTMKAWSRFTYLLRSRQKEISENIRSSEIGPLLEVTLTGGRDTSFMDVPSTLLGSLLIALRAEEEVVLTQDQRELLHKLVIHRRTISEDSEDSARLHSLDKVRPAAISALALLGNHSSLPVLERFARKTDDPVLRQAALQSADQIRERMAYDPQQMLRAAHAPERTETLLRAAAADPSTASSSQQLLRANVSGNPSEPEP